MKLLDDNEDGSISMQEFIDIFEDKVEEIMADITVSEESIANLKDCAREYTAKLISDGES